MPALRLRREGEQLLFCALKDLRHCHVGDHTATGAESDRVALGAVALISGLQLSDNDQRAILKREALLAARLCIETGLVVQDSGNGDYDLIIHPLGGQLFAERDVADLTLQPRGEFAVDHHYIGGKHEIVDEYRLRPQRCTADRSLRFLSANVGTAGNSQHDQTDEEIEGAWSEHCRQTITDL